MMMLFAYYVFLFGIGVSGDILPLLGVVAGLTFYNSCVICLSSSAPAFGSLPKGQQEAALAIGLTSFATLRLVLLPASDHDDAALHRQPACRRVERTRL
jgi:glutamate transport system permease protein